MIVLSRLGRIQGDSLVFLKKQNVTFFTRVMTDIIVASACKKQDMSSDMSRPDCSRIAILLVAALLPGVLGTFGCWRQNGDQKPKDNRTDKLTAIDARDALIRMIENRGEQEIIKNDEDLDEALPYLKRAEIREEPGGVVSIGVWECRLKNRTFYADASSINSGRLLDYAGVFERNAEGKWEAVVTRVRCN